MSGQINYCDLNCYIILVVESGEMHYKADDFYLISTERDR